jgi:hypothetical protein
LGPERIDFGIKHRDNDDDFLYKLPDGRNVFHMAVLLRIWERAVRALLFQASNVAIIALNAKDLFAPHRKSARGMGSPILSERLGSCCSLTLFLRAKVCFVPQRDTDAFTNAEGALTGRKKMRWFLATFVGMHVSISFALCRATNDDVGYKSPPFAL